MASTYESQMPRLFITRVLGFTSLCAVPTFILPPLLTAALQTSNTGETGHTTFPAPHTLSPTEEAFPSLRAPRHYPLFHSQAQKLEKNPHECKVSRFLLLGWD